MGIFFSKIDSKREFLYSPVGREWKKSIPEIRERKREGNDKIHSHNSGTGIRGFHSRELTGTGIHTHPLVKTLLSKIRIPFWRLLSIKASLPWQRRYRLGHVLLMIQGIPSRCPCPTQPIWFF